MAGNYDYQKKVEDKMKKSCTTCVYFIGNIYKSNDRFEWTHCRAGVHNLTKNSGNKCRRYAETIEEAIKGKFEEVIGYRGWDKNVDKKCGHCEYLSDEIWDHKEEPLRYKCNKKDYRFSNRFVCKGSFRCRDFKELTIEKKENKEGKEKVEETNMKNTRPLIDIRVGHPVLSMTAIANEIEETNMKNIEKLEKLKKTYETIMINRKELIGKFWALPFVETKYKKLDYYNKAIITVSDEFKEFYKRETNKKLKFKLKIKLEEQREYKQETKNEIYDKISSYDRYRYPKIKEIMEFCVDNAGKYKEYQLETKICKLTNCIKVLTPETCPKCNVEVREGSNYCDQCGEKI